MFGSVKDYFDGRKSKRVARAAKVVTNAKAIRDDRWAAIQFLADDVASAQDAIPALLPRFEYSLEHGINDTREKELAMRGIVRFGTEAVPFVQEWLKSTTRIAWPIKVLVALGQDQIVIDCLTSALNYGEVSFNHTDVDKNYDILCYLREYQIPDSVDKIAYFLDDSDERVRFAAAEFLAAQEQGDIRKHLERFLFDDTAENRRLHNAAAQLFIDRAWKIDRPEAIQAGRLGEGLLVGKDGALSFI